MPTINPTTGAVGYAPGEKYQGGSGSYNFSTGKYELPSANTETLMYNPNGSPIAQKTNFGSTPAQPAGGGSFPTNSYSVVTSKPATADFSSIQNDYNNRIQPGVANTNATTAANKSLPVIAGYNVSATPTGNQGEAKSTNPSTGQSYFITPQKQDTSVSPDTLKGILSAPETANTAGGGTTTTQPAAPSTPTQIAQAQTGVNPSTENANYNNSVTGLTDALTSTAQNFQSIIQSLSAGSVPLTSAQQSLVEATNNAFQQMTSNANLKAAALSSETGGVSNKVNAMGGQLIQIATEQAAAVARMEVGFQTENFNEKYQTITSAYAAFKDAESAKMTALTNIHNSVMSTYQNAVQAAQAQQTFNQTVYKDAQSLAQSQFEFRDLKDSFGNTVGTQVFDKKTGSVIHSISNGAGTSDPTNGHLGTVSTDVNTGQPNANDQAAFLQTIPSAYRDLVKGIADYRLAPPNTRTKQGAQIMSWVTKYNPSLDDGSGGFDEKTWTARNNYIKNLNSGTSTLSQGLTAANKTINHLTAFSHAVDQLGNSPVSSHLNALGGAIERPLSGVAESIGLVPAGKGLQSIYSEANTEKNGLKDEMAKFFKGTGVSDMSSIKDWGDTLDVNATPSSKNGVIQGTLTLFTGQLSPVIEQFKSTMGREPTAEEMGLIVRPETLQKLSEFKNQGYRIDLPGVPYTDKNAYLSNGGSQESLNSAYKMLKDNGIPTTAENILQAAQLE